jgi:hypothetical protein
MFIRWAYRWISALKVRSRSLLIRMVDSSWPSPGDDELTEGL